MRSTDADDLHLIMSDAEVMAFWDITQVVAGCYAVDHPALSLQAA